MWLLCHYVNEGILQQVLLHCYIAVMYVQDRFIGSLSTDVFNYRRQLKLYVLVSEAFLVDPHQNYYRIALIFISIILLTS